MVINAGAIFDPTATYRYRLWRQWQERLPWVGFVMLNPSRADASKNDPTIRRCLGLAQTWGYGGLEVVNLFAYCTASPQALRQAPAPIGPDNDAYLRSLGERVERIILAWGNGGTWQQRHQTVLALLPAHLPLYCLGQTQAGQPRHPLYLRRDVIPACYSGKVSGCHLAAKPLE